MNIDRTFHLGALAQGGIGGLSGGAGIAGFKSWVVALAILVVLAALARWAMRPARRARRARGTVTGASLGQHPAADGRHDDSTNHDRNRRTA